jgi:hypothetical protein
MAGWRSRFLSISCVVLLGLELHAAGRTYHKLAVSQLQTSQWTHVEVTALVTYVRYQDPKNGDGDWHITLEQDGAKVVAEIIPLIPLTPPKKGQRIRVWGISRIDKDHGWGELHPVEGWELAK